MTKLLHGPPKWASLMTVPSVDRLVAAAQEAFGYAPAPALLEAWVKGRGDSLNAGIALACGLFHQDPAALVCFERHVLPSVAAALRKAGATDTETDELVQRTRSFLIAEGSGSRLEQYQGQGAFNAFVTTVAMRFFTRARTRAKPESSNDDLAAQLPAAFDLERVVARAQHRALFSDAFQAAINALSPRERLLLRLNLVKGASIDELAPMYRVSRATVARWLARARQALRDETVRRLAENAQLATADVTELIAGLQSQFDVSLQRFLDVSHSLP